MSDIIATYTVNVGDGEVIEMTGDLDKLDLILHQMKAHDHLVKILEKCADYIKRVSDATLHKEPDFSDYDLLDEVETAVQK